LRETEIISHPVELSPVSGVSTSVKTGEKSVADTYKTGTRSFLTSSTSDMEKEILTIPQRLDLSSPLIMQSIDWHSSVYWHLMKVFYVSKVSPITLVSMGNYQMPFPSINEKFLPKIDDALRFLHMKIESSVEGVFFKFKGAPRRPPGFVVDMRIVISEYNREVERQIYHFLADMIRKNPRLLFDAHVIASKERKLQDFLPHDYNRYIAWSG